MKKYKNIVTFGIILICLILCILILDLIYDTKKFNENTCDNIDYESIAFEINLSLNSNYIEVTDKFENIILSSEHVVFADNNIEFDVYNIKDNYYIVFKDINLDDLYALNYYVMFNNRDNNETLTLEQYGKYTYMISSKEHYSTISGIMRSFIYCN